MAMAVMVGCSLIGCGVGMSPAGGSNEDIKSAYENMPLDKKIELINSKGIPAEKKKEMITEAYRKAGKTPPAESAAPAGANDPASGPPPGMGMPSQGGR